MKYEVKGLSPSPLQTALVNYRVDEARIEGLEPSQVLEEAYKVVEELVMGAGDVSDDIESEGGITTFRAVLASEAIIDKYGVDAYAYILQHCKNIGMSDAYAVDLLDLGNDEPRVIQKLVEKLQIDMPRPQPSPTRLTQDLGTFPQVDPLAFNPEPVDMRPTKARMQLLQNLRQMLVPTENAK